MALLAATLEPADLTSARSSAARRFWPVSRRTAWTLLWIAMGVAAVYFLAPQLGSLSEAIAALRHVQPAWVLVGGGLVAARYIVAAASLIAATTARIPLGPTVMVQLATSFVGRLTPEGVGWLVLNQRFLERTGLARGDAAAAIALRVVAGAAVRLLIVVVIALLVGGDALAGMSIPLGWPVLLAAAALAMVLAVTVGFVLRSRAPRISATIASGAAGVGAALRSPRRAAVLFGGSAGVTIGYVLTLAASVTAFGIEVPFFDLFAMYLAATAVAAASPTPGNLGALEVTLAGGLVGIGVPAGVALGAVLVFRLLTFWAPLLPGFVAFRYLQNRGHL